VVAEFTVVRGGLVVIDHGLGVVSAYYHQSRLAVKPGARVERGQKIGEVGSLG
jgi:murein DD-endopeptidase MepM/ murein hydrolase activator NlpD